MTMHPRSLLWRQISATVRRDLGEGSILVLEPRAVPNPSAWESSGAGPHPLRPYQRRRAITSAIRSAA